MPLKASVKTVVTLFKATWTEFKKDDAPRMGAALAYYTAFSMAPILVIAIGIIGLLFGSEAAHEHVSQQIQGLLGPVASEAVLDMLENVDRKGGGVIATIIGVVTLVVGASTVFMELTGALNRMWDAPPPNKKGLIGALRARGLSFAMVLVIGFLLLVSLLLSALLSTIGDQIGGRIAIPEIVLTGLNTVVSLGVITALFGMLYKVLPNVKIPWGDVWVGAFFTAALFVLGKGAIGIYLGRSSIGSAYGAAGSFAVMLVWIYYSAQLVLFGAEFTQVYARHHGSRRGQPRPSGTAITHEAPSGL